MLPLGARAHISAIIDAGIMLAAKRKLTFVGEYSAQQDGWSARRLVSKDGWSAKTAGQQKRLVPKLIHLLTRPLGRLRPTNP